MEPVRWGIISTAEINRAVIPPLQESPESELVAVASREQARADAYAAKWGIPHAYASYEELLADPDVEAVYISTPNGLHVDGAIRSLEAGKHVLVEKPFSRSPGEVERAYAAAEKADRLLMEAFMYRHHPQTLKLAELVRDGVVGELRYVHATFSFTVGEVDVRLDPELEGGAGMDVGCYTVSGSRLVAGEPLLASARQLVGPSGVDLRLVGTLVFSGDVLGQVDCAFDLPLRQGLEVVGREGTLTVASPFGCERPGITVRRGDETEWVGAEDADRYRLQSDNLSRAIRRLEPQLLGRDDALGQARAIDALYRSAELGGEPVEVASG